MDIKTGIYYFTWYNEQRWKEAPVRDAPLVGEYNSSDPSIIAWQLDLMRYCGLDYVIFEVIPTDDWGFATVERGIEGAIAYLRTNGMHWSFLLDPKRGPSNGGGDEHSEFAVVERMYRYVQGRGWSDGLARGPSGQPLMFVFAPTCTDAILIREELGADVDFRMPIFLPDRDWDSLVELKKMIPPGFLGRARRYLGGRDRGQMPLVELLVALGYISFWGESVRNCGGFSSIIPGYDDLLLARVPQLAPTVSRHEGRTLGQQFLAAVQARPEHIITYGWNEYFEGTCIEPSRQFGMQYVELLRSMIGEMKGLQTERAQAESEVERPRPPRAGPTRWMRRWWQRGKRP